MLGIITGTFVAIGVDVFRYIYFAPKLVIGLDRPEEGANYSCHSVVVRNIGRRVAISVQGFVTVENLSPSHLMPTSDIKSSADLGLDLQKFGIIGAETVYLNSCTFRTISDEPLAWSAVGSRSTIDIYPKASRLLDVCRFIKSEPQQIHIPSMFGWQALLAVLKPDVYSLTIRVVATTGKEAHQRFQLCCNGKDISLAPLPG
ncbi:hypothetical protein [Streptomyces sp. NBC_00019]|uniref:hypothetical protein n=1 Tax=Streptomyces sp. NBC_00019 TaxID=2975623 RepID=UPI0032527621